jgi:protein-S-isoprenylcysteine O-methyltransferase Ste14
MYSAINILFFCLLSVVMVYASRASLLKPRSHGFYRFFAWELMLLLFLMNRPYWFKNPFSLLQMVSWTILAISAALALYGLYLLLRHGKNDPTRKDAPLMRFEKTAHLVTTGIYRYIRHPLYASLLYLTWGILCKQVTGLTLLLAAAASVLLYLTVAREEDENIAYFGHSYIDYMQHSKRFVPYLF